MKFQSYIMIRCIAPNNINVQELSAKLKQSIQQQFPNLNVNLTTNIPYWKEPAFNSIIYGILNNQNIKVSELIKILPLSWEYSEENVYNLDIQQSINKEDAIWSQLCHPEETFLNSIVDWVHIYTSQIAEEPTIH